MKKRGFQWKRRQFSEWGVWYGFPQERQLSEEIWAIQWNAGLWKLLGQKSCRTKVSRIFRIFVPNFTPNFAPNFPRIFWGLFVLRFVGDGGHKKFINFSRQNSQANTKKLFTKFFWRAGKVKNWKVAVLIPFPKISSYKIFWHACSLHVVRWQFWGAREGGRTLRKGVFLPSKRLLSAFYITPPPSKNPSKNPCLCWNPYKVPSKNPSKKALPLKNLLRTLLRSVRLHDPLGVRPKFGRFLQEFCRNCSLELCWVRAASGPSFGEQCISKDGFWSMGWNGSKSGFWVQKWVFTHLKPISRFSRKSTFYPVQGRWKLCSKTGPEAAPTQERRKVPKLLRLWHFFPPQNPVLLFLDCLDFLALRAVRAISMSRAKNSLPIVPRQSLSLFYPLWSCPSNCRLKWFDTWKCAIWGQKIVPQNLRLSLECPRGEGSWAARQGHKLSRGTISTPRQPDVSLGPLGGWFLARSFLAKMSVFSCFSRVFFLRVRQGRQILGRFGGFPW